MKKFLKELERILDALFGWLIDRVIIKSMKYIYQVASFFYPFLFRTYTPIMIWMALGWGLFIYPYIIFKIIGLSIILSILLVVVYFFVFLYRNIKEKGVKFIEEVVKEDKGEVVINLFEGKEGEEKKSINIYGIFFKSLKNILEGEINIKVGYSNYFIIMVVPAYIFLILYVTKVFSLNVLDNFIMKIYTESMNFLVFGPIFHMYDFVVNSINDIYSLINYWVDMGLYKMHSYWERVNFSGQGIVYAFVIVLSFVSIISMSFIVIYHAVRLILHIINDGDKK